VPSVYVDPVFDDRTLRDRLYAGEIVVYPSLPAVAELAAFARAMVEEAFAPHHPVEAQHHIPVERWVEIFAPVKPAFIHHPETRGLIARIVEGLGLDLDEWYLDVPRLRGVTSDGYLTSGVGYAHHPHRDTWFSAPMAQINWWLPLYPFEANSSMAFHPKYFAEPVANESNEFDYYEWNAVGRKDAAKMIGKDTRKQPHATEEVELDGDVRVVCPVGGVYLFSGAQLHSTVANDTGRSRFSIDFRTVHVGDLREGRSAPNVDSRPQGTALRDFVHWPDKAAIPDDVIARYDTSGARDAGVLVFTPNS
jgi:hypothetical protein